MLDQAHDSWSAHFFSQDDSDEVLMSPTEFEITYIQFKFAYNALDECDHSHDVGTWLNCGLRCTQESSGTENQDLEDFKFYNKTVA